MVLITNLYVCLFCVNKSEVSFLLDGQHLVTISDSFVDLALGGIW